MPRLKYKGQARGPGPESKTPGGPASQAAAWSETGGSGSATGVALARRRGAYHDSDSGSGTSTVPVLAPAWLAGPGPT